MSRKPKPLSEKNLIFHPNGAIEVKPEALLARVKEHLAQQKARKEEAMTAKPCPFCGGSRVSVREGSTFRWLYASCDECGAQAGEVRVQTLGEGTNEQWRAVGEADAMEAWNTRAAP